MILTDRLSQQNCQNSSLRLLECFLLLILLAVHSAPPSSPRPQSNACVLAISRQGNKTTSAGRFYNSIDDKKRLQEKGNTKQVERLPTNLFIRKSDYARGRTRMTKVVIDCCVVVLRLLTAQIVPPINNCNKVTFLCLLFTHYCNGRS